MESLTIEDWPPEGMSDDEVWRWHEEKDAKVAARKKVLVDFMYTGVLSASFELTYKDILDMMKYRKKEREDYETQRERQQDVQRKEAEVQKAARAEQELVDTWMAHILDDPCTEESTARRLQLYNNNEPGEETEGHPAPRGKMLPKRPVQAYSLVPELSNKVDAILKASLEAVGDHSSCEYYM